MHRSPSKNDKGPIFTVLLKQARLVSSQLHCTEPCLFFEFESFQKTKQKKQKLDLSKIIYKIHILNLPNCDKLQVEQTNYDLRKCVLIHNLSRSCL